MQTTMNPPIEWKRLDIPTPYPVVQMIVTDGHSVLAIHRSHAVRSAKNIWSMPSGMHDIGETRDQCARRELLEEFGLTIKDLSFIGAYENIVLNEADNFHWIIQTCVAKVRDFTDLVNREPDKHDEFRLVPVAAIETMVDDLQFHDSFTTFWKSHYELINIAIADYRH